MRRQVEDDGGDRENMKPETTARKKKPYRSPRLMIYGDLRRLTMAKGGKKAEATGPKSKAGTE